MKTLLTLTLMAFFAVLGAPANADEMHKTEMMSPSTTLVMFHSDNCGSCKTLGPKLKEAINTVGEDKLNIVKFDYTNRDTIEKSKMVASEEGLSALQKQYGSKTGFAVLLDENGNEIEKISSGKSVEHITKSLHNAVMNKG